MVKQPTPTPAIGDNRAPLVTLESLAIDFAHVEKGVADFVATAAKDYPNVLEDDDDLAKIKAGGKLARALAGRLDDLRDENKRPYREAGDEIQKYFKALQKKITDVLAGFEDMATVYLREKDEKARKAAAAREATERAKADALHEQSIAALKEGDKVKAATLHVQSTVAKNEASEAATTLTAKPGELARTHTDRGVATLADKWEYKILDYSAIDYAELKRCFATTAIDAAVARFVAGGGRELKGVHIYPAPRARI